MTGFNDNVVPSLIDKIGQGTFGTLICTKLLTIFSFASINDGLTAVLTSVSIVYMMYKIYNEHQVRKERSKKE